MGVDEGQGEGGGGEAADGQDKFSCEVAELGQEAVQQERQDQRQQRRGDADGIDVVLEDRPQVHLVRKRYS